MNVTSAAEKPFASGSWIYSYEPDMQQLSILNCIEHIYTNKATTLSHLHFDGVKNGSGWRSPIDNYLASSAPEMQQSFLLVEACEDQFATLDYLHTAAASWLPARTPDSADGILGFPQSQHYRQCEAPLRDCIVAPVPPLEALRIFLCAVAARQFWQRRRRGKF